MQGVPVGPADVSQPAQASVLELTLVAGMQQDGLDCVVEIAALDAIRLYRSTLA